MPLRRNRDYRLWWAGNLLSLVGSQMTLVAMPLMVLLLTGSPARAGLVSAFGALPYAFLALPVGVAVDRVSRRALLVGSGTVSFLAWSSVALAHAAGVLGVAQLLAVAFVSGAASVVYLVAQSSTLPAVVGEGQLGTATAQAETVERLAAIAGPPAAALLFYGVWSGLPFAVDALSFGAVVACVLSLRSRLGPEPPFPPLEWRKELVVGARTVARRPLLRDLTALNTAGDGLFAGIGLLMIVLVREAGTTGPGVGFVFAAAAVGGVLGATVANRIERGVGLRGAVIGKHVLTALTFPLLALGLPTPAVGLLWATISFQVSVLSIIQRKEVLEATSGDVLGRVQGFVTFLSFGSLPLGSAATGFLLEAVGGTGTVLAYAAVLALLALFSVASPGIRGASGRRTGP